MYPNYIPLWNVVPSTLSEALTHSQALLSMTGKVYLFGDFGINLLQALRIKKEVEKREDVNLNIHNVSVRA